MTTSITIPADDPAFWPVVDLLKKLRLNHLTPPDAETRLPATPQSLPADMTEGLVAQAEIEHLLKTLGRGSKTFLQSIVAHCLDTKTRTFTISDLAERMNETEKYVRANQRNVMKRAGKVKIELWQKEWDQEERRQVFSIHARYLEALRLFV